MDIRLALITGADIPVPECQLALHQPSIYEISLIGEEDFFIGVQTLCISKEMISQGETISDEITNFQIFMMIMNQKELLEKKEKAKEVLLMVLPKKQITFTPNSILLMGEPETIIIDEKNFDSFQDALKVIFCLSSKASESFNPANGEAKKIADKIMRGRQRIAAEKGGTGSVLGQYISSLAIGLHIPVRELINYTLFQLYDQIERFGLYVDWDIDIKSRLAGATPKGSPENWMKDIH